MVFVRTTPPRPVDVTAVFPELAPLARPAIRLHPRPRSPSAGESSVGGPLLWPAEEPWPHCEASHLHVDSGRRRAPTSTNQPRSRGPGHLAPARPAPARPGRHPAWVDDRRQDVDARISAALLPYPSPPPHALVADLQQPCDLSTRASLPEQLGRPHAPGLGQLRPRQRRNDRSGDNRRRLERHNIRLPPTSPSYPLN